MKWQEALISFFITLIPSTIFAQAPTAQLSLPSSAFVDETLIIDARSSTNVCKTTQADTTPSIIINLGDGKFIKNILAGGHIYRNAGVYTVGLTVKSCDGISSSTSGSITINSIPTPSGGDVNTLTDTGNVTTNSANLQTAINTAYLTNTTEKAIRLPDNFKAKGIIIPTTNNGKYVIIEWVNANSLPRRTRISGTINSAMPVIYTPSSTSNTEVGFKTVTPAPISPPHHLIVRGIRFAKDDETQKSPSLFNFGTDSGGGQTLVSKIPHHLIVERCYFDGGTDDNSKLTNGIRIYGDFVTVVDSYFHDIRVLNGEVDSAAISITTGNGPYAIWNNDLRATTENFSIAGGPTEINTATLSNCTNSSCTLSNTTNLKIDSNIALPVNNIYSAKNSTIVRSINGNNITFDTILSVPTNGQLAEWAGAIPSFVSFRENYTFKPLKWWWNNVNSNGIHYAVKNLWEAKFGRYIVVAENYFKNSWIQDQDYALVLTVRRQNGGETAASVIRNVWWDSNILENAGKGMNILASDSAGPPYQPTQLLSDIFVTNNLFRNVGLSFDSCCAGHQFFNLLEGPDGFGGFVKAKRIHFIHNTFDNLINANMAITDFGSGGGALESVFANNLMQDQGLSFFSSAGVQPINNLIDFLPPGNSTNTNKNFVVNTNGHSYPAHFLTQTASWPSIFTNYSNGNFKLINGHIGKNAATDGTDIGIDYDSLALKTANVISGNQSSSIVKCNWNTNPSCN